MCTSTVRRLDQLGPFLFPILSPWRGGVGCGCCAGGGAVALLEAPAQDAALRPGSLVPPSVFVQTPRWPSQVGKPSGRCATRPRDSTSGDGSLGLFALLADHLLSLGTRTNWRCPRFVTFRATEGIEGEQGGEKAQNRTVGFYSIRLRPCMWAALGAREEPRTLQL